MDDLEHLLLFSSLASIPDSRQMNEGKPFQSLVFLVRDWPHPKHHSFGKKGGKEYLKKVEEKTTSGGDPKKRQLMAGTKSSFQDISCYLMPSPGSEVTEDPDFELLSTITRGDFLKHLKDLTEMLLTNPVPKKIGGLLVTPSKLAGSFKRYTELFSKDDLPEPRNLAQALADDFNEPVIDKSVDVYEKKMKKRCSKGSGYLKEEDLKKLHGEANDEALEFYQQQNTLILSSRHGGDLKEKLKNRIEEVFQKYKETNNGNKGVLDWVNFRNIPAMVAVGSAVFSVAVGPITALSYMAAVALPTMMSSNVVNAVSHFNRADNVAVDANVVAGRVAGVVVRSALVILFLLIAYCIFVSVFFSVIPFLRPILVSVVGEPGLYIMHLVIFSIIYMIYGRN